MLRSVERGLGGGSKERVTWAERPSEAPCGGASEGLQRADVTQEGVGKGGKEEGEDHKKREPEFSIARAVFSPVRAGMVSGSVIGSSGASACTGMGSVEPIEGVV